MATKKSAPTAEGKTFIPLNFIHTGRCLTMRGVMGVGVDWLMPDGTRQSSVYALGKCPRRVIGGVYSGASRAADDGTVRNLEGGTARNLEGAKWTGERAGTPAEIVAWEVAESVALQQYRLEAMEADTVKAGVIDKAMQPLRVLYTQYHGRGDWAACRALEAAVQNSLRRIAK